MKYILCKCILSIIFLIGITSTSFAQKQVSGKITDQTGAAMPGVSVIEERTSNGTITDLDGNYTLVVANEQSALRFSFIGYLSETRVVGVPAVHNVQLEENVKQLEELVITGYSIDERKQTTSAVSTVKAKDIQVAVTGNVEQMLQGRVAGVTVITNGQPGTQSQIRIRGFGSFGGNEPLYIVDGVPVTDISFINPVDIENITTLKDASAASIYGARAANGVIVYTTKRGARKSRLNVTFDGYWGVNTQGTSPTQLNPTEFAEWTWTAQRNTATQNGATPSFSHPQFGKGSSPVIPDYLMGVVLDDKGNPSLGYGLSANQIDLALQEKYYNVDARKGTLYQTMKANKSGTDWYNAITRPGTIQRYSLGMSGGTDHSRYYFGFGAQNSEGILKNNNFGRYAFRANSEFDVLPILRIGENLQFTYLTRTGALGSTNGQGVAADENSLLASYRIASIIPVYDEEGGYGGTAAKGFNNPRNPVGERDNEANNTAHALTGFGNIYLELEPIPGLVLRTSWGTRYGNTYYLGYTRRSYENSENNGSFRYSEGAGYFFSWITTNTIAYKKKFGLHNIDVLVGQEALNTGIGRSMNASGQDPFSRDLNFVTLTNTSSRVVNGDLFNGVTFASYFGKVSYSLMDRYLISATVRRDGSSRFGPDNRYALFPAFSAAWRLSNESFMQSSSSVLSELKLRFSWGQMGNSNNVDPYNQFTLYGTSIGASSYDISGSNTSAANGYYRTKIGSSTTKWETNTTLNIGVDANLWKGKLEIYLDLWQKTTADLLFNQAVPITNGNARPPDINVGTMVNKGIDLQIIHKGNFTTDLGYEVDFNIGLLSNQITDLGNIAGQPLEYLTGVNPDFRGIFPIRNQLNQSISAFYGYEVQGLFANKAEVDAAAKQEGSAPGRFRFKDINGDKVIDEKDRTYLGSPVPNYTGGLTFTLKYKGFDLSTYIYYQGGNKIFNHRKWWTDFYPSFSGAGISSRVKDSWTPSNTGATIPIYENVSNFSTNTQSNSYYVEDGSYLRMQNITLGYSMPKGILSTLKLTNFRVFFQVTNVFTATAYTGIDPQVGGQADTSFGIDIGNYPITRGFNGGINLSF